MNCPPNKLPGLTVHVQVVDYHFRRVRRDLALVHALVVLVGSGDLEPPVVRVLELDRVPRVARVGLLADRQQLQVRLAVFPPHPGHLRRDNFSFVDESSQEELTVLSCSKLILQLRNRSSPFWTVMLVTLSVSKWGPYLEMDRSKTPKLVVHQASDRLAVFDKVVLLSIDHILCHKMKHFDLFMLRNFHKFSYLSLYLTTKPHDLSLVLG